MSMTEEHNNLIRASRLRNKFVQDLIHEKISDNIKIFLGISTIYFFLRRLRKEDRENAVKYSIDMLNELLEIED